MSALNILLTATISVPNSSRLSKRIDPNVRSMDYEKSLEFWTQLNDDRIAGILFCDNSGADLTPLKELSCVQNSKRPVEWHQFADNHVPDGMHYGYAELGIIDRAFESSSLLFQSRSFAKVTGRLIFPGISLLLDRLSGSEDVVVDCRRAYLRESGAPLRVRTELMLFNVDFYKAILFERRAEMFGLCSHLEEYFAYKLEPLQNDPNVKLRFPIECAPVGVSGAFNSGYANATRRLKTSVRSVTRRMAPWIWI